MITNEVIKTGAKAALCSVAVVTCEFLHCVANKDFLF